MPAPSKLLPGEVPEPPRLRERTEVRARLIIQLHREGTETHELNGRFGRDALHNARRLLRRKGEDV